MNTSRINKAVVLVLALLISVLFLSMVRSFLLTILLAGIFAGLLSPMFNRIQRITGNRGTLSAGLTVIAFLLIILLPLTGLLVVVAGQAIKLGNEAVPLIREQLKAPEAFQGMLVQLPFYRSIEMYSDLILQKAGELLERQGSMLFRSFSAFTYSAVYDIFLFFIFLYTVFFFLKDGSALLTKIQYYLPLNEDDQHRLFDKFVSVARATIKGSFVVGAVQGSLAGLAFWVAGIDSAVFWGAIMAMMSLLPLVGTPVIWVPASIYLAFTGQYITAISLFLFCSIVVSQIDNIIRPMLVGRDVQMHALFIFYGTLGGIGLFGLVGIIVGPIIAALFVTVWEIYGEAFSEALGELRMQKRTTSGTDVEHNGENA